MFRMVKYEIRKNILGYVIMLGVIGILQVYFTVSALTDTKNHTIISTSLLLLLSTVTFFAIFVFGVASYSRELNRKTGYLTFMAPVSSLGVIGSKLTATLIMGTLLVALVGILGVIDMALFQKVFPESKLLLNFFNLFLERSGYNVAEFWFVLLVTILNVVITFFAILGIAYLSITLSSTAFQNKKWKGVVSVLIFIVIALIVSKITEYLPSRGGNINNLSELVQEEIPQLLYMAVVMAVSLFGSAKLLDKYVSL